MLGVTHLAGFAVDRSAQNLLNNATGTNIGNTNSPSPGFTAGGLAAAFDSNTAQNLAACCRSNQGNDAWFGKYFSGAPKIWSGFRIWSHTAGTINGSSTAYTGLWDIYVKTTGQSTSGTDGTLVTSGTWTEPGAFVSQYTVSDILVPPTLGESVFIRIRYSGSPVADINLAEVQFYYDDMR